MFTKLKQYKDLRDKAKSLQSQLSQEKVEGSAAWGKIKIGMDGNFAVTNVEIADDLISLAEKAKLTAGIKDAVSDAVKKAQQKMVAKMKESGDFKMPGM